MSLWEPGQSQHVARKLHSDAHGDSDLADLPEFVARVRNDAKLAEAVREYLRKHPQSMDTAEGIGEWWIAAGERPSSPLDLRRVLDSLTEQGVLERVGRGDYAHYRAKRM